MRSIDWENPSFYVGVAWFIDELKIPSSPIPGLLKLTFNYSVYLLETGLSLKHICRSHNW